MEYDVLLNEAAVNNIQIKETTLKSHDGLCYGRRIVINDKLKTLIEKKCVLAEELGHYYTTVGTILNDDINHLRQEKRARNWGYEKLVPILSIIRAYESGARSRRDLADFLSVTDTFLVNSIIHYKEKYGLYYHHKNYIITFEPLSIYKSYEVGD